MININVQLNVHLPREPRATVPSLTVGEALHRQMEKLSGQRSRSTMANYATASQSLLLFLGADRALADVDARLLCGYERWLRQRGVCLNTVSCYMRSLRSLLGHCCRQVGEAFEAVYTGSEKTAKRSIPLSSLSRLQGLSLAVGSYEELARDVFLFSTYAMGMPFVDVAHLRRQQVAADAITYRRQKTGQCIRVAIEAPMAAIMARHGCRAAADWVFPLLSEGTEAEYAAALNRYNRALRRLSRLCGLDGCLTSYMARHTWASTAYAANVNLPVISRALGHTNTQTTLTYIREIDDNRLAEANRQVIAAMGVL